MSDSPADVRTQLIDALRLDLVGPRPGHPPHAAYAEEVLPIAPSKWYLTGFLISYEAPASQRSDADADEQIDQLGRALESDDDKAPEQASARKAFFPTSMGLSVLVSADAAQLHVRVAGGDYVPVVAEAPDDHDEAPTGEPLAQERADQACRFLELHRHMIGAPHPPDLWAP